MSEETVCIIKIFYILSFAVVSSYYLWWGDNEQTVFDPVDETGWVADGVLANFVPDS